MPVRSSFLFYSCQKKNSWRYDIQGGRGNTPWEYNDNRNCFHGCTCLQTDATVHRYRPHSRRKNVCHRNSGRYAVLQSLCISVTNSLPYLMSILLVDFYCCHVLSRCPTSVSYTHLMEQPHIVIPIPNSISTRTGQKGKSAALSNMMTMTKT